MTKNKKNGKDFTTKETIHYKRGMAQNKQNEKLSHCPKCGAETPCQPIKKKEFEKVLKAMWKVSPPKN